MVHTLMHLGDECVKCIYVIPIFSPTASQISLKKKKIESKQRSDDFGPVVN